MSAKRRREEAAQLLNVSGPLGGNGGDDTYDEDELVSLREKYDSDLSSGQATLGDSKFALSMSLVRSGKLSNVLSGVNLLGELNRSNYTDRNVLWFLSLGLSRLNQYAEARAHIEQLAKQEPENLQVKNFAELVEYRAQKQKRGRRIMVFLDGLDSGVQAFFEALSLAVGGENGDTLYLVSVIESIDAFVDQTLFGWEAMLDEKKGELVEHMQSDFVRWCEQANVRHVSLGGIGGAKDVLVELADEEHVDLLVIGHDHDASFFSKAFGTTVADHCLHNAPCHVIVAKDTAVLGQLRRERRAAAVPEPPRRHSVGPASSSVSSSASASARPPSPPRRRNLSDAEPVDEPITDTIMKSMKSISSFFSFGDEEEVDADGEDEEKEQEKEDEKDDDKDQQPSSSSATADVALPQGPPPKTAPRKPPQTTDGPPPSSPAPDPPAPVEGEKKKFIQKIGVKLPFPGKKE